MDGNDQGCAQVKGLWPWTYINCARVLRGKGRDAIMWGEKRERRKKNRWEREKGEELHFWSPTGPCLCVLAVITVLSSEGGVEKCVPTPERKSHGILEHFQLKFCNMWCPRLSNHTCHVAIHNEIFQVPLNSYCPCFIIIVVIIIILLFVPSFLSPSHLFFFFLVFCFFLWQAIASAFPGLPLCMGPDVAGMRWYVLSVSEWSWEGRKEQSMCGWMGLEKFIWIQLSPLPSLWRDTGC